MHEPPAATGSREAGRSPAQRRIVAGLIVSSGARRCSDAVEKVREVFLRAQEGSGSDALSFGDPPASGATPRHCHVMNVSGARGRGSAFSPQLSPGSGLLDSGFLAPYALHPYQSCGCPVARPSPQSRYGVSCIMRARGHQRGQRLRRGKGGLRL